MRQREGAEIFENTDVFTGSPPVDRVDLRNFSGWG